MLEIIEGGAGTGKTTYLKDLEQRLIDEGKVVYYINAAEPIGKWFDSYVSLPFKNAKSRIQYIYWRRYTNSPSSQ